MFRWSAVFPSSAGLGGFQMNHAYFEDDLCGGAFLLELQMILCR